jgi:hypothetical protein
VRHVSHFFGSRSLGELTYLATGIVARWWQTCFAAPASARISLGQAGIGRLQVR